MKTLTDKEYVKIGLWLDDPYGDGIRLSKIRNPSAERLAALDFVKDGQTDVEGLYEIYLEKGKDYYHKAEGNRRMLKRHNVLGE